jgi:hypothetical protein
LVWKGSIDRILADNENSSGGYMQPALWVGFAALIGGALFAFKALPPRTAALAVFFGGWLFAPVGVFPAGSSQAGQSGHPFWILGSALPSDMLLHKAWLVPCAVLLGALVFDRESLRRFRLSWFDAPVLLWCAWPLMQSLLFVGEPRPEGAVASLYLLGSWSLAWFIGRVYCAGTEGLSALARALALSGLACLPFALIEGLAGAQTYGWFFEPHPFRHDGNERYLGWRPLGFFENGNQYGLWISLCALVAAWLAWSRAGADRRWRVVAALVLLMALAAQSIGGLLLAALGAVVLWLSSRLRPRWMATGALAAALAVSAVYVSGVVPVASIANDTALGRATVGAIKSVGRGSFTWRIAQDQRALPLAMAQPLAGTGHWNWWRAQPSRPWGLAMLLLGQFGLIGAALSASGLLLPAARIAWTAPRGNARAPQALPWLLAIVILLSMLDAVLNSFVFFPAVMIAAALSTHER